MPIRGPELQCFPHDLLTCGGIDAVASGFVDLAAEGVAETCRAGRRWWVVHTKARQEKSVARELLDREIPYFLPQIPKTSVIRGRRRTSYIPLFTGYVFVYGSERERHESLTTNRVANTLPVNNADELTRDLLQVWRLIEQNAPLTVEARLRPGDRVRVRGGALAGVEGTVLDRRGKCRVLVAVRLLQQGVSMEIDDFLLEPI